MEPEDMYSQGDRLDPHKDRWERAVGGAVDRIRQLLPPQGPLARETDCCDEGIVNHSGQCPYSESRPLRLRHPVDRAGASAMITGAAYGRTEECCDPDSDYYASRDPWYMQSQSSRQTFDTVGGEPNVPTNDSHRDECCSIDIRPPESRS